MAVGWSPVRESTTIQNAGTYWERAVSTVAQHTSHLSPNSHISPHTKLTSHLHQTHISPFTKLTHLTSPQTHTSHLSPNSHLTYTKLTSHLTLNSHISPLPKLTHLTSHQTHTSHLHQTHTSHLSPNSHILPHTKLTSHLHQTHTSHLSPNSHISPPTKLTHLTSHQTHTSHLTPNSHLTYTKLTHLTSHQTHTYHLTHDVCCSESIEPAFHSYTPLQLCNEAIELLEGVQDANPYHYTLGKAYFWKAVFLHEMGLGPPPTTPGTSMESSHSGKNALPGCSDVDDVELFGEEGNCPVLTAAETALHHWMEGDSDGQSDEEDLNERLNVICSSLAFVMLHRNVRMWSSVLCAGIRIVTLSTLMYIRSSTSVYLIHLVAPYVVQIVALRYT